MKFLILLSSIVLFYSINVKAQIGDGTLPVADFGAIVVDHVDLVQLPDCKVFKSNVSTFNSNGFKHKLKITSKNNILFAKINITKSGKLIKKKTIHNVNEGVVELFKINTRQSQIEESLFLTNSRASLNQFLTSNGCN